MMSRSRSSGIQSRACNTNTGDGVLGGAESDRGGLPGEGEQDPEDFPGSRVCFGAQICRVLGMCAALCRAAALCRCCLLTGSLEMPHRSNYSCAPGQYFSTDGSP